MKKSTKILIAVLAVILVLSSAVVIGGGNYLVSYAIGRSGDGGNRQVALEVDQEAVSSVLSEREVNAAAQAERTKAFFEANPEEKVDISAKDGTPLSGFYFANEDSHLWAIVIHGYRSSHYGMLNYAERYHTAGYQVIAPDLRGCGQTGSNYVGMGWPDRLDMLEWIHWIIERDPDAVIVLHGVSMGGATVMMTSGEETPANVIAFVDDCGYTSVWDIFASELGLRFHLPTFPLLYSASAFADLRAGYRFGEASALKQVEKCEKPMLFIHGTEDDFIPYSMALTLYEAKPGDNKQLLSAENAGHGQSSEVLGETYWETVFAFLAEYLPH